jgi:hypothetical protein
MRQLITEIRQGDEHKPVNDDAAPNARGVFEAGLTIENGGIEIKKTSPDADEPDIDPLDPSTFVTLTWQYEPVKQCITRTRTVGGANATTTTVALYVQEFLVRMEPVRSPENIISGKLSFDLLQRAVVTMTLRNQDATGKMQFNQGNGLVTERIIDAAVPRKNFSGL